MRYVSSVDERIADINGVTLEQVKQFYTEFYGANTGELSVVGDFDAADYQEAVRSTVQRLAAASSSTRVCPACIRLRQR